MEAARKSTDPAPPRQATSAAVISAVCGSNDLLHEILLRLDFPTDLVCAAAVSKRWLQGASDGTFLRRFRHLHPPRLLGFYVCTSGSPLRFVPLPQPPELAAVIRRGSFELGDNSGSVSDCRNGRLLIYAHGKLVVCSPLHSERGTAILPQNKGVFGSWPMKAIPNFGYNADFVFLRIQHEVFYVHISSRTVEKVYETKRKYEFLHRVYPFMMVWPPTFLALNGDHDE